MPGNDSFSKWQGTVYAVQGSGRTLQALNLIPIMPKGGGISRISADENPKIFTAEGSTLINQAKIFCAEDAFSLLALFPMEFCRRKAAVYHHLALPIHKAILFTVFQAQQSFCQHCKTKVLSPDLIPFSDSFHSLSFPLRQMSFCLLFSFPKIECSISRIFPLRKIASKIPSSGILKANFCIKLLLKPSPIPSLHFPWLLQTSLRYGTHKSSPLPQT